MAEQTEIKDCCITGHLHIGTPGGSETIIGGRKTYVTGDSANKARTVVFLHDVWGYHIPNTRLLADEYAKNGFYVLLPDLVDDHTIPEWVLRVAAPKNRELDHKSLTEKVKDTFLMGMEYGPWLVRHRRSVVQPIVEEFVAALRMDPGIKQIFSVGFCWGAAYSVLYAKEGFFDAVVANHPSFLSLEDLEGTDNPILICVGDKDTVMTFDKVQEFQKALPKLKQPAKLSLYPEAIHGFTNRGDLENELEKQQKEDAMKEAVAWFTRFSHSH